VGYTRSIRASIIDGYRRAWTLADATLDELPLDTVGAVPWWPADDNALTLHTRSFGFYPTPNGTPATPTSSAS
jgi:hypothetical protein